jgi:dUTPase
VNTQIWPRTGLAFQYGITVLNGLLDPDYRGEVHVILANFGHEPFRVERGAPIAQLIPVEMAPSPRDRTISRQSRTQPAQPPKRLSIKCPMALPCCSHLPTR